jgi:hypothetical protein
MSGLPRSIPQLLDKIVRGRTADMHVMLPAQVQSYDGTQFVAVNVMVQHPVWNDDQEIDHWETIPTIPGVPVCWPRFGGFMLAGPLSQGDEGMLIFASAGIGEWRSTGQSSQPADAGRHTNGWPVFVPMLFNDTRTLPSSSARAAGIVLGQENGSAQLLIQSGLIQAGTGGSPDFVALATPTNGMLTALKTAAASLASATTIANVAAAGNALQTDLNLLGTIPSTIFKAE